jgi:hypothetical protein
MVRAIYTFGGAGVMSGTGGLGAIRPTDSIALLLWEAPTFAAAQPTSENRRIVSSTLDRRIPGKGSRITAKPHQHGFANGRPY